MHASCPVVLGFVDVVIPMSQVTKWISSPSSLLQRCHLGWHFVHLRMSPIRVQVDDVHGSVDCTASACPPLGFFQNLQVVAERGNVPRVVETQILKNQTNGQKWQFLLHFCSMLWGINIYSHVSHALKIPKTGNSKVSSASKETTSLLEPVERCCVCATSPAFVFAHIWDHEGVPKHNFQTISASPRGTSRSSENTRSSRPGWWRCSHIFDFWGNDCILGSCICPFSRFGEYVCFLLFGWFSCFFLDAVGRVRSWTWGKIWCNGCIFEGSHRYMVLVLLLLLAALVVMGVCMLIRIRKDQNEIIRMMRMRTTKAPKRTKAAQAGKAKATKAAKAKKNNKSNKRQQRPKLSPNKTTALRFNLRWLLFTSFFSEMMVL